MKTGILSAISLYMMMGDGEGSPECYCIATTMQQARKLFEESWKMVNLSPLLTKHVRKRKSDIYFPAMMGTMKPLAGKSETLDGLNSHLNVLDEVHAITDRNVLDVLLQATSFRKQPLTMMITTNGYVRENLFDDEYKYFGDILEGEVENEHALSFLYELDHIDEWEDETCWQKANPAMVDGNLKTYAYMRGEVAKAKAQPSYKPTVMTKQFNMPQTGNSAWMPYEFIENKQTFYKPETMYEDIKSMGFKYGILGFDKSETRDLMAATIYLMRPDDTNIYSVDMYWLPFGSLEIRANEDNVPYDKWTQRGFMREARTDKNEVRDIMEWVDEFQNETGIIVQYAGYDRWHVLGSDLDMVRSDFGKSNVNPVIMGAKTLSPIMKEIEVDFEKKRIIYNNHPITKLCLVNTQLDIDSNNNVKPVKGKDNRKRIDGTIAHLCAFKTLKDNWDSYTTYI